jgi:hypothetical protein
MSVVFRSFGHAKGTRHPLDANYRRGGSRRTEYVNAGLSAIVGTVGALVGVILGGWWTARSQRTLLKESQRQSAIQARESAYTEFLVAYRRFRRFLMNEATEVRLVGRPGGEKAAPLIDGAADYWASIDSSRARLEILAGDRIPSDTWWNVHRSFMAIARVRATCGPGEIPDELIHAASTAEAEFIQAARDELIVSGAITPLAPSVSPLTR